MASRRMCDLHPSFFPAAFEMVARAHEQDIDVLVYCTYRSAQEQNELYAIGRTKIGRKVTNAKGGQSAHNATFQGRPGALALDCVPLLNGKPQWNAIGIYKKLAKIAEELGIEWGGNWKMRDCPHFEMPEWKEVTRLNP